MLGRCSVAELRHAATDRVRLERYRHDRSPVLPTRGASRGCGGWYGGWVLDVRQRHNPPVVLVGAGGEGLPILLEEGPLRETTRGEISRRGGAASRNGQEARRLARKLGSSVSLEDVVLQLHAEFECVDDLPPLDAEFASLDANDF